MDGPPPPKPRILVGSILSAVVALWSMAWIGHSSRPFIAVFEQFKVPMPALLLLLVSIPLPAWWAGGLLLAGFLVLKDLRLRADRAFAVNSVVLPLLFFFLVGALQILVYPLVAGLGGISEKR